MFNLKSVGGDQAANSAGQAKALQAAIVPARLYSAMGYNSSAGTVYLLVFDSASTPADGAVPLMVQQILTLQTGWIDWQDGRPFAAGIYVCFSSTDTTKTLVLANSGFLDVVFRKTS